MEEFFLKLHNTHFPRLRCVRYKFVLGWSINKGIFTFIESTFYFVYRVPLYRISLKLPTSHFCACSINDILVSSVAVGQGWSLVENRNVFGCVSTSIGRFSWNFIPRTSHTCAANDMLLRLVNNGGHFSWEQKIFSDLSRISLEGFS